MKLPAIIVDEPPGSGLRIAALSTLDRLVVSLHRAGASPVILVSAATPVLRRATALGLAVEVRSDLPPIEGPALIAAGNVLVHRRDVERVLSDRRRLHTAAGVALPLGVVQRVGPDWRRQLDAVAPCRASEPAAHVVDAASAQNAEHALWASLTSSSDGFVDRHFNRPVGRWLSKVLIFTPVTPNQVSVGSILLGLWSAWWFAQGSAATALAGAWMLQLSAIVDCVDGDLARVLFKESPLGKWLDLVGDQVVHIGVFLGLGVGLWRAGSSAPVVPLAVAAAVGVVLSFLVVLRGLLRPDVRGGSRLQKLVDATTNRDFSVLLIVLAWLGKLEVFLWLAAVGSHVFWLAALALQSGDRRSSPTGPS